MTPLTVGAIRRQVCIGTVPLTCDACPITHQIIVTREAGEIGYAIPSDCSCGAMLETVPHIMRVVEDAAELFTPRLRLL